MTIIYINLLAWFYASKQTLSTHWAKFNDKIKRGLLSRIDMHYSFIILSYICWFFHKCRRLDFRRSRLVDNMAAENYQLLLKQSTNKKLYSRAWRIKNMLEHCVYCENKILHQQMRNIAQQLDAEITKIEQRGKTPILSPLHMGSDMLAAVMCSMLKPYSTTVISIYKDGHFGLEEHSFFQDEQNHSLLTQVNPAEASSKLARQLKKAQKRQENIVIFADALPQITYSILGYSMPTKPVTLFNRKGSLHNGIDRIMSMINAEVIFFYLYWEDGVIKLRTFPSVNEQELTEKTVEIIEISLSERPYDWFMWHVPNLFYSNLDK